MAQRLTDVIARSAAPPTDGRNYAILYDVTVRGFGVRVTRLGARSWILNYRARGVERRLTIGAFPTWRCGQARDRAMELRRLIDIGGDPLEEARAERVAPTIADLVERYREEHLPRKRPRSIEEDEGLIRQWILPELGDRKIAMVRRRDVETTAPQDQRSHAGPRQSSAGAAFDHVHPGDRLGTARRVQPVHRRAA
jgi:hypothetical protein